MKPVRARLARLPTEYKFVAQCSGTMAGVWLLDRRSNTATKSEFITEESEHFGIEQKVARTSHRAVLLPVSPASRTAMRPVTNMPSKVPAPPIDATGAPRP